MAHELDINNATGRRAMFSVKETPWHNEGIILNEAPSFAEALRLAGCDYDVATKPVYVQNADGTFSQSATGQAVVRLDRGTELGEHTMAVVGDDYVPVQNREAFEVLEPLIDKGVAFLETGGTLRHGADAWMLVRFDIDNPVVREVLADEVIPFGLIANNHTGAKNVLLKNTPIRVVCANTLGAAEHDGNMEIRIRHTKNARVKVVEAAEELFAGIVERYVAIAEQYRNLKERILSVEEFTSSVLNVAAPLPKDVFTPEGNHLTSKGYDRAYAAAETRRDAILVAWSNGKGHTGDASAWEAYNAAVEVVDHDANLFRTRGSRVASMLGGRLLQTKQAVLDSLVVLARN